MLYRSPPGSGAVDGFLVGRFQPFHLGHLHAVRYALARTARLHVGIGSSDAPPDARNPFTAAERRRMILGSARSERLGVFDIPDCGNHSRWADQVSEIVPAFQAVFTNDAMTRHVYERRGTAVLPVPFQDRGNLSGTRVRELMASGGDWRPLVPEGSRAVLEEIGAEGRLRRSWHQPSL